MSRYSPPVKSAEGAIIIRPLRDPSCRRLAGPSLHLSSPGDNGPNGGHEVARANILRDILILASIAITAVAGSAVLLGLFWREVALARNEARLVEIEQITKLRMAEIDAIANQHAAAGSDFLILGLVGVGILMALACLLRPIIVTGR